MTNNKQLNALQDAFLNQCRKEEVKVLIRLSSGSEMSGLIRQFDNFTIALEDGGTVSLIYKHALAAITPSHSIELPNN